MVRVENGGEHVLRALAQPGELLRVGPRDPGRGVAQAVSLRVLADRDQDLFDRALDARQVELVVVAAGGPTALSPAGRGPADNAQPAADWDDGEKRPIGIGRKRRGAIVRIGGSIGFFPVPDLWFEFKIEFIFGKGNDVFNA